MPRSLTSDPSDLAADARCLDSCIPDGMQGSVTNYLLTQILITFNPMADITLSTIIRQARCFDSCIPPGMQQAVTNYLLFQISGGGGGTGGAQQVFQGSGDPVGLQPGQNPLIPAVYTNTDNGVVVSWIVGSGWNL